MEDKFKFNESSRLGKVLSRIFGGDERNLVNFSIGLGIPGAITAAIANRYFDFPIGKVEAHPDFRVVAAGNTLGTGADYVYSGRYCLDGASLDRFSIVIVPYSLNIEKAVTDNNEALIDFCHKYRTIAREAGIKTIFSYRGLEAITKLRETMDLQDVLRICLVKGMNKDDLNTIQLGLPKSENEFIETFKRL